MEDAQGSPTSPSETTCLHLQTCPPRARLCACADLAVKRVPGPGSDWRTAPGPDLAARLFSRDLLGAGGDAQSLFLSMDIRRDRAEQDRALVDFYNRDGVRWTAPLLCQLKGDAAIGSGVDRHLMSTVICKLRSGFHINFGHAAITKVFEGEPDHLIPSVSDELLDNRMFAVAGRMIGHSFLHHGPSFPGLSPAVLHVLFGGSPETTPITIRDCPDLDVRDAVRALDGDGEIRDLDAVHQLCLSSNLPPPNATNRKWLSEKLLFHFVIEQTRRQIQQLLKGLKETGLWPLVVDRRDVIPILFPRESEAQLTPQMILDCIVWPSSITIIFEGDEESDEDESDAADVHRVSGYLKTFIENASPAELKSLTKFWTGWEVPATEMRVEVVEAPLPTASTCFEKLRLPRRYAEYRKFQRELSACISTSYSGFGRP